MGAVPDTVANCAELMLGVVNVGLATVVASVGQGVQHGLGEVVHVWARVCWGGRLRAAVLAELAGWAGKVAHDFDHNGSGERFGICPLPRKPNT